MMALALEAARLVVTVLSVIVALLIKLLAWLLLHSFYLPDRIQLTWSFVRDFCNLFFILILIVMAFGTIFNLEKFSYRKLLVPFLVSALLINFSYPIGYYIIDVSNQVGSAILFETSSALGDPTGPKGLENMFSFGAGIGKIAGQEASSSGVVTWAINLVINLVTCTGLGSPKCALEIVNKAVIALFLLLSIIAFFTVIVYIIVRIPFLWALLIISPVAFLGFALPNARSKTWTVWWEHFLSWCLWIPVFSLIVLFLAIIMQGLGTDAIIPTSLGLGFFDAIGFTSILTLCTMLIFLVGGIWASFKIGKLIHGSGAWVGTQVLDWTVGRTPARSLYKAGKLKGADIGRRGAAALPFGLGERWKSIPGLGRYWVGTRGEEESVGRAAQWMGVAGAHGAAITKNVEEEKQRLLHENPNLTRDGLNVLFATPNLRNVELAALYQIQAEKNMFHDDQTEAARQAQRGLGFLGGTETEAGKNFVKTILPNLRQTTTDVLFQDARASGNEALITAFGKKRAESGWIPHSPTGQAEAASVLQVAGGGRSVAGKEYRKALQTGEFYKNNFANLNEKQQFFRTPGLDAGLEQDGLRDMVKRKEIQLTDAAGGTLTEGYWKPSIDPVTGRRARDAMGRVISTWEQRVRLDKDLIATIRNNHASETPQIIDEVDKELSDAMIQHTDAQYREELLMMNPAADPANPPVIRIAAMAVRDKGEIDAINKLTRALGALEIAPNSGKETEMLAELRKLNMATVEEFEWTRKHAGTAPTPTQLAAVLYDRFRRMDPEGYKKISSRDLAKRAVQNAVYRALSGSYGMPNLSGLGDVQRNEILRGLDARRKQAFTRILSMTTAPPP